MAYTIEALNEFVGYVNPYRKDVPTRHVFCSDYGDVDLPGPPPADPAKREEFRRKVARIAKAAWDAGKVVPSSYNDWLLAKSDDRSSCGMGLPVPDYDDA